MQTKIIKNKRKVNYSKYIAVYKERNDLKQQGLDGEKTYKELYTLAQEILNALPSDKQLQYAMKLGMFMIYTSTDFNAGLSHPDFIARPIQGELINEDKNN